MTQNSQVICVKDSPAIFYVFTIDAGLRLIHLRNNSACPIGKTWEGSILESADDVQDALNIEDNVGILLQGKDGYLPNLLGVWCLEIDSKAAGEKFSDTPFNLMFSDGDTVRKVLVARLPDNLLRRRSRTVKRSHTVRMTGIIMGPGSHQGAGGVIKAHVRDRLSGQWTPWDGERSCWASLSVVDPTPYLPLEPVLIPLPEANAREALGRGVGEEWIFRDGLPIGGWLDTPYKTAPGDYQTRLIRGRGYVRSRIRCGIVSRSGEGGRYTLLVIANHLLKYLRLSPSDVLDLLNKQLYMEIYPWNVKCCDGATGLTYPWTDKELVEAITAANEYVPYQGVVDHELDIRLKDAKARLQEFMRILSYLPEPDLEAPSMSSAALYNAFLELFSLSVEDCSQRRFSLAFQDARRCGFLKLKGYQAYEKEGSIPSRYKSRVDRFCHTTIIQFVFTPISMSIF